MRKFSEIHPITSVIYLASILVMLICVGHNLAMVVMLVALSLWELYHKGIKGYIVSVLRYGLIIAGFGIFNVIFVHTGDTPFLYINDKPLTVEALIYGLYNGCMVSILLLWFNIFQTQLDEKKIIYLFGKSFPTIGLIISMSFCFYDKFRYKIDKIKEVWQGIVLDERRQAGYVFVILMSVMLEDSVTTAQSMVARGYGKKKRTFYNTYRFMLEDYVLIAIAMVVCGFSIVLKNDVIVYGWGYLVIPVIYNLGKELQWKFYLSKI